MATTALHFEWINNAWVITTDAGEIVTGVENVRMNMERSGNHCGCAVVDFNIDKATMKTTEA